MTMMGTRTTAVMARMAVKRHQRPRMPASESARLVLPGRCNAEFGTGFGMGVEYCAHYSTLDFRIWRYRMTETTTRVRVMRKAMATPGPVWKSWKTVR